MALASSQTKALCLFLRLTLYGFSLQSNNVWREAKAIQSLTANHPGSNADCMRLVLNLFLTSSTMSRWRYNPVMTLTQFEEAAATLNLGRTQPLTWPSSQFQNNCGGRCNTHSDHWAKATLIGGWSHTYMYVYVWFCCIYVFVYAEWHSNQSSGHRVPWGHSQNDIQLKAIPRNDILTLKNTLSSLKFYVMILLLTRMHIIYSR